MSVQVLSNVRMVPCRLSPMMMMTTTTTMLLLLLLLMMMMMMGLKRFMPNLTNALRATCQ